MSLPPTGEREWIAPAVLADFTAPDLIVPDLGTATPEGAVRELCARLARAGRMSDGAAFLQAVLARERLSSTVLDNGLAIPHSRLASLSRLSFALGRSFVPIAWSSRSAVAVRLVFLLAVPANDIADHLGVLSGLAQLEAGHPGWDRLLSAPDAAAIFAVLQTIKLKR